MLNKSKELNNMSNQADYTTLAKYFRIPKDAKETLNDIDRDLLKVMELIDEASFSYDGSSKEPNANDVKDILKRLESLINKYRER